MTGTETIADLQAERRRIVAEGGEVTDIDARINALRDPHDPYIDAVIEAMEAQGVAPSDWWTSTSETAEDGQTLTLSAVLSWNGDVSPDLYPDGLLLCWDLDREWQHAAMKADGSNEWPADLLPLWALPADVAASARALLRGEELPPETGEWSNDAVFAAVQKWVTS